MLHRVDERETKRVAIGLGDANDGDVGSRRDRTRQALFLFLRRAHGDRSQDHRLGRLERFPRRALELGAQALHLANLVDRHESPTRFFLALRDVAPKRGARQCLQGRHVHGVAPDSVARSRRHAVARDESREGGATRVWTRRESHDVEAAPLSFAVADLRRVKSAGRQRVGRLTELVDRREHRRGLPHAGETGQKHVADVGRHRKALDSAAARRPSDEESAARETTFRHRRRNTNSSHLSAHGDAFRGAGSGA